MKKGKRILLWIIAVPTAIVVIVLVMGLIAVVISNMGDRAPKQAAKVSKQAPQMSIERMFVSIDHGLVFEGDQDVIRCRYLFKNLADRFNTTKTDISDKTVVGRDTLRNKYGVPEELMNILEDMHRIIPSVNDPDYGKYVVGYIHLRRDGFSRLKAAAGAEIYILEMGYSLEKEK